VNAHSLRRVAACAAALAGLAAGSAQAQPAPSMEERLRTQLRATTTQLQQVQSELAALKSRPAAPANTPDPDVATLRKELAAARGQLAAERDARGRQRDDSQQLKAQAEATLEKASSQVAQYRQAYDELLKIARTNDAERQRLAGESAGQRGAIAQCEAKNAQLFAVGQEVLHAYETLDIGDVISARQPFATKARVRFDEIAQQYGDRLHEGRFDARAAAETPRTP
jgi:colicin import membrane protein